MPVTLVIIAVTVFISIKAFNDPQFKANALFVPAVIKNQGETHRWVSAGFIHADWMHLIFNMYALYIFGPYVERAFVSGFAGAGIAPIFGPTVGAIAYIVFYVVSIAAASYMSYQKHQDNYAYSALGASGAVAAMMWPLIFLMPWAPIFWGFIPPIVLGVGYILYSNYADKRGGSNIGHSAHLWGCIFGLVAYTAISAIFAPDILQFFVVQLLSPITG